MSDETAFADQMEDWQTPVGDVVAEDVVEALDEQEIVASDQSDRPSRAPTPARAHRYAADALYGAIPVSRWAQTLLEAPIFERLAAVSLSDSPGELLFRRSFPSRLTHSLGVYYLTRQARPRDRALQAAALAHDLGHGPFSHLTESLMMEQLGMNHEQRSVALLRQALARTRGVSARLLAWLDADEVAALMLGDGPGGRGKLLNGPMDYDNLDNVARFLQASGLGTPSYDPRALARAMRLVSPADGSMSPGVALAPEGAGQARAWLADRKRVYTYLGEGERNLAIHGMLRKAVDLAAQAGMITSQFFDATDWQALRLLRDGFSAGASALADAVLRDALYRCVWEAGASASSPALTALFARGQTRLAVEERVATEAGLLPHEVTLNFTLARGERTLPPTLAPQRIEAAPPTHVGAPQTATGGVVTLFITHAAGRDYARRAGMAAERALADLGVAPRA